MKVAIIEDETLAAEALEAVIRELRPEAEVKTILPSVEEAITWFETQQHPELLFCDIQLTDGTSFEIFEEVEVKCPVIFTTAYNEYAIEAFKVNSIDYLLKPLKKEEVAKALRKYEELQGNGLENQLDNLKNLLQSTTMQPAAEKKTRFMVKSGQSIKVIPSTEVAYFLAEEGVVFLMNSDGKRYLVNYTLDELENRLDPHSFFRANRQLIVNINAVAKAEPYFKGRLLLHTEPAAPENQVISSSKASSFKEWLDS